MKNTPPSRLDAIIVLQQQLSLDIAISAYQHQLVLWKLSNIEYCNTLKEIYNDLQKYAADLAVVPTE